MKLNIEELMGEAENDARDYYKARLNQPCGGATFDGDFLPERNRAFARRIVERCAVTAQHANDWRGGHGEPGKLSGEELATVIRKLLEAE